MSDIETTKLEAAHQADKAEAKHHADAAATEAAHQLDMVQAEAEYQTDKAETAHQVDKAESEAAHQVERAESEAVHQADVLQSEEDQGQITRLEGELAECIASIQALASQVSELKQTVLATDAAVAKRAGVLKQYMESSERLRGDVQNLFDKSYFVAEKPNGKGN